MKNVDLISTNSNITFNNDIYALTGSESFVINAGTGNVTFNGSVGLAGSAVTTGSPASVQSIPLDGSMGAAAIDSSGIFLYAANFGGPEATIGAIRFLDFTAATAPNGTKTNGITIWNGNQLAVGNWGSPNTGNLALNSILNSIRWTSFGQVNQANNAYNSIVGFEMSGLTPGATYKLQLLIYEDCCTGRNSNIELVNGNTTTTINAYTATAGTADVITHGFVASSKSAVIKLIGMAGAVDKNPIFSGFSLEVKPNAFKIFMIAVSFLLRVC
jgi:hypothetical protein